MLLKEPEPLLYPDLLADTEDVQVTPHPLPNDPPAGYPALNPG